MAEKSVAEISWRELLKRKFTPSPKAWEDQVFYFLMLDRFSDGKENQYQGNEDGVWHQKGTTPLCKPSDYGNAINTPDEAANWQGAGGRWVGEGTTIAGLTSKLGYLRRLGITTLWVSPPFKQSSFVPSYHGYAIQDFLDVDPHFGTREQLREMVDTAHANGIRVILDIVLNHSANVFEYNPDRYWTQNPENKQWFMDARWDGGPYGVKGFYDENRNPSLPMSPVRNGVSREAAIWPIELQEEQAFMRKGHVSSWDYFPEYCEGDFFDLKKIFAGYGPIETFQPTPSFFALCQVYRFWMLYLDLDGYRIDTVKHLDKGAARLFGWYIHEAAQAVGKDNFYLIGEITGGRNFAVDTLELVGLDAALGIDEIQEKLCGAVKGTCNPEDYFALFRNSLLVGKESHTWFRDKVLTQIDDHDKVPQGNKKSRFCAYDKAWSRLVFNAMAFNVTTLGIPCIYYGTEQAFDGEGRSDQYIRETMYGGGFGAFRTKNVHFFDEQAFAYREFSKLIKVRAAEPALRRGRQYLRDISGNGVDFGPPRRMGTGRMLSVVAWSRILADTEILAAMNTNDLAMSTAWVCLDANLHPVGSTLLCLYSSDVEAVSLGTNYQVQAKAGRNVIQVSVPAAGFLILK